MKMFNTIYQNVYNNLYDFTKRGTVKHFLKFESTEELEYVNYVQTSNYIIKINILMITLTESQNVQNIDNKQEIFGYKMKVRSI